MKSNFLSNFIWQKTYLSSQTGHHVFLCNNRWTGEEKVKMISVLIRLKIFILSVPNIGEKY